jgi:hypothetical protein
MTESAPPGPGTLAVSVDREKLREALRRNTLYLAGYGVLLGIVAAGIVALAVTEVGRFATYALLGVLSVILLSSLGTGLWLRRRVRGFLSIREPFLAVSREGLRFAGVPLMPWSAVRGVIYSDESASPRRGRGFARWAKNLTYGAGGARIALTVGLDDPKRYHRAATGELERYLTSAVDVGGMIVHLDTALNDTELARVRAALREATEAADVGYLDTDDPRRVGEATSTMMTGRMNRTMRGVYSSAGGEGAEQRGARG